MKRRGLAAIRGLADVRRARYKPGTTDFSVENERTKPAGDKAEVRPRDSAGVKAPDSARESCSLRPLLYYFRCLGTFGFGDPIALAGYMQRELVVQRRLAAGAVGLASSR
jgi:hypothetical protein